jgi:Arc/MetJ-type ribon-helix-helix transcriptional regulator
MADTEKITINMSVVDLGQIDLLVSEGFYSSRTDLIRTAVRNQIAQHSDVVKQAVVRKSYAVGVMGLTRHELEKLRAAGQQIDVRVVGMVAIEKDVSPELAAATIKSLAVYGALRASDAVKAALNLPANAGFSPKE